MENETGAARAKTREAAWWADGPTPGPCNDSCDGWMHPVGNRMKLDQPAVMYECDTCMNEVTYTVNHLQRMAASNGSSSP